jgi:hypothetical protein
MMERCPLFSGPGANIDIQTSTKRPVLSSAVVQIDLHAFNKIRFAMEPSIFG